MPTEAEKKRRLLDFLQQRVFGPISRAKATGPDASFIRDAQRAVERTAGPCRSIGGKYLRTSSSAVEPSLFSSFRATLPSL